MILFTRSLRASIVADHGYEWTRRSVWWDQMLEGIGQLKLIV